jgi:hypothetical protein
MIATRLAVLMMTAMIIGVVGISVAAAPLVAEAQIATIENGVGIADQSNVVQNIEQVQNQEAACTTESGEQSNDCEVDQTQTANAVSTHETTKSIINNIR